jgi:hypothetical protein
MIKNVILHRKEVHLITTFLAIVWSSIKTDRLIFIFFLYGTYVKPGSFFDGGVYHGFC